MIKYYCDKCGKELQCGNFATVTYQSKVTTFGCRNEEEWQLYPLCEMELTSNFLNPNIKKG